MPHAIKSVKLRGSGPTGSKPVRGQHPPNKTGRKKAYATRSREGCMTCRDRKIRCDQIRPECGPCTKSRKFKFICDFASPNAPQPSQNREIAPRPALDDTVRPSGSSCENRSLSYYQQFSAREFSGYFDHQFWKSTVLAIGNKEPVVRHILVALGALHESYCSGAVAGAEPAVAELRQQADVMYGKFLNAFRNEHLEKREWSSLEVTLTCAALSVAFEWLRGNIRDANVHLSKGLGLMAQWLGKEEVGVSNSTPLGSPEGYLIRTQLKPVFVMMALQSRTVLDPPRVPLPVISPEDGNFKSFSSIEQARDALIFLLVYLFPETLSYRATLEAKDELRWDVHRHLERWAECLKQFVSQHPGLESDPQVGVLRLWHTTADILFYGEKANDEVFFDHFTRSGRFESVVDQVELLLRDSPTSKRHYSVEMGIVPVLYYVAIKCRHPATRRRAISLLQASPRREAIWDSVSTAAMAMEFVNIEEAGLEYVTDEKNVPKHARVAEYEHASLPDDPCRRLYVRVKRHGEEDWSLWKLV